MGHWGGIIIMWDKRVMELSDYCMGEYLVEYHFKSVDGGFEWASTRVYGPNLDSNMSLLFGMKWPAFVIAGTSLVFWSEL